MKVFPYSIVTARQMRGLKRCELAAKLEIPTSKLREYEKVRRIRFKSSPDYNRPFEIEIPNAIINKIAEIMEFPLPFFQHFREPKDFQPKFICQIKELCDCGKEATLLCDYPETRLYPVYADTFNDFITELKPVKETCDIPICENCRIKSEDKDFCQYHSERIRPPNEWFCMVCTSHHKQNGICSTKNSINRKHLAIRVAVK